MATAAEIHNANGAPAPPWMDRFQAPLPPCTMETLPEPVTLSDGSQIWPLMLGCYQLEPEPEPEPGSSPSGGGSDGGRDNDQPPPRQPSASEESSLPASSQQERSGQLNLYCVKVPNVRSNLPTMPLSFGEPQIVLHPQQSSGILDGKWASTLSTSMPFDPEQYLSSYAYATAHATGELRVHALRVLRDEVRLRDTDPLVRVDATLGNSETTSPSPPAQKSSPPALCLSLHWNPHHTARRPGEHQIVSSYSNGRVAVHDVHFAPNGSSCQVVERDSWHAHSLFTAPSEVWSTCFCGPHLVASGGDDGHVKFWDVRATNRPTQVWRQPFTAGVTCLSPHPRFEHMLACGSYDECWALYDVRHVATPLYRSQPLGGGIWRIQWHPANDRRLLLAVMHGGCRVVQCRGLTRYCGPISPTGNGASASDPAAFSAPTPPPHQRPPVVDRALWHPNLSSPSFGSEITQTSTWSSESGGGGGDLTQPIRAKVKKSFEEHTSMTYGAAWLVCRHPQQPQSYFEAAASCSFYDREVMIWDSVF